MEQANHFGVRRLKVMHLAGERGGDPASFARLQPARRLQRSACPLEHGGSATIRRVRSARSVPSFVVFN